MAESRPLETCSLSKILAVDEINPLIVSGKKLWAFLNPIWQFFTTKKLHAFVIDSHFHLLQEHKGLSLFLTFMREQNVKALLMYKSNIHLTCTEFYENIKSNVVLLKKVLGTDKYH